MRRIWTRHGCLASGQSRENASTLIPDDGLTLSHFFRGSLHKNKSESPSSTGVDKGRKVFVETYGGCAIVFKCNCLSSFCSRTRFWKYLTAILLQVVK